MLYLIGLGLSDEKDISVRGLEIVKRASRVYLEAYTAILLVDKQKLEDFYGRPIIEAGRDMVESDSESILANAQTEDIAFLVVGDPFSATTHSDLVLRARQSGIPHRSIPNASILTAVGATGLQLYNFGQTVSMVFFTDSWKPTSYYSRVAENAMLGMHTLVLLDIKVKEPSLELLARGKIVYEPPRYMRASECARQLIQTEEIKQAEAARVAKRIAKRDNPPAEAAAESDSDDEDEYLDLSSPTRTGYCTPSALAVAIARAGSESETIVAGTLEELASEAADEKLGAPLHSLVLLGKRTHELERDMLLEWALDKKSFQAIWDKGYAC